MSNRNRREIGTMTTKERIALMVSMINKLSTENKLSKQQIQKFTTLKEANYRSDEEKLGALSAFRNEIDPEMKRESQNTSRVGTPALSRKGTSSVLDQVKRSTVMARKSGPSSAAATSAQTPTGSTAPPPSERRVTFAPSPVTTSPITPEQREINALRAIANKRIEMIKATIDNSPSDAVKMEFQPQLNDLSNSVQKSELNVMSLESIVVEVVSLHKELNEAIGETKRLEFGSKELGIIQRDKTADALVEDIFADEKKTVDEQVDEVFNEIFADDPAESELAESKGAQDVDSYLSSDLNTEVKSEGTPEVKSVAREVGEFTFTVSRDQLVDLATQLAGKGFKATPGNENEVLYQKGATAYMVQRVGDEAQIKVECSVQQLAKEIRRVIDIYPSAAYTIEAEGVAAKVLEQVSYEKDLSDELEMQSDQEAALLEKASFEQVLTEVRESSITDLEELEVKTYLPPDLDKENKDLLGTRLKGLNDENLEKVQAKADDHLEKLEQWKASQGTSDVEVNQIYGRLKGNIEQFKDIAERSKKIPTLPIIDLQELPAKPVPMPRKDRLTGVSPATAAQPESKPASLSDKSVSAPRREWVRGVSPTESDRPTTRPAPPTTSPAPLPRSTVQGRPPAPPDSLAKSMYETVRVEAKKDFQDALKYVVTLAKVTAKATLSDELTSLRNNINKITSTTDYKNFDKKTGSVSVDKTTAFKAIRELDSRLKTAEKKIPIFNIYHIRRVRDQLLEMGRNPKISEALREVSGVKEKGTYNITAPKKS